MGAKTLLRNWVSPVNYTNWGFEWAPRHRLTAGSDALIIPTGDLSGRQDISMSCTNRPCIIPTGDLSGRQDQARGPNERLAIIPTRDFDGLRPRRFYIQQNLLSGVWDLSSFIHLQTLVFVAGINALHKDLAIRNFVGQGILQQRLNLQIANRASLHS